ncbi:hypothetical protein K2173_005648 [Erythroxylum novogranatense]|uniref:GTD-binding domain-containing protein n=1 Tax=Erythroxylum novogranatense TaxID=1862640 RepID=A0AAV8SQD7_9ROSI|nr:hypothetical protein K2173_005648 [Erythroxylum novogranatense]
MELEAPSSLILPKRDSLKCCNCGCRCSLAIRTSSGSWLRSVKRKYDEFEEGNWFFVSGLEQFSNPRVQIENECVALREMVSSQQQTIQDLSSELEEERNASCSAANEAMSMILRLQREKAEIQMEARQFKRFAEEKTAHDQQESLALQDLLYKREQTIQSLTCEVQAYKHRMMSFGLTEAEVELELERVERFAFSCNPSSSENIDLQFEFPECYYPPLKCNINENHAPLENDDEEEDVVDVDKYAFGETPRDRLRNLEYRIHQMEKSPRSSQMDKNVLEKVIVGYSPRRSRHSRRFSTDSLSSFPGMSREGFPDFPTESPKFKFENSVKKVDCVLQQEDNSSLRNMENASEFGDDTSDRIYTIDSVHNGAPYTGVTESKSVIGMHEDFVSTPTETLSRPDFTDPDIKKLYMRLQALEADRESLRQAIISMRTDKAQLVLLKEIAQHLYKDMTPQRQMAVMKPSVVVGSFSLMSLFKWIMSFVFWRKKARRSKYLYSFSPANIGLLMLLENGPRTRQWRCLTRTQV